MSLNGAVPEKFSAGHASSEFAHKLAEVFALQELLDASGTGDQEHRIYFQWPMYWADQEVPDTLEGEAFFSGNDDRERGFSLRVLVSPPALGTCELHLHALRDTLWIHLGAEREDVPALFLDGVEPLKQRLAALGWASVRCTARVMKPRASFLSPAAPARSQPLPGGINIRV